MVRQKKLRNKERQAGKLATWGGYHDFAGRSAGRHLSLYVCIGDDRKSCSYAIKRKAGRTRETAPENRDRLPFRAEAWSCCYKRAETFRQSKDGAIGASATGLRCPIKGAVGVLHECSGRRTVVTVGFGAKQVQRIECSGRCDFVQRPGVTNQPILRNRAVKIPVTALYHSAERSIASCAIHTTKIVEDRPMAGECHAKDQASSVFSARCHGAVQVAIATLDQGVWRFAAAQGCQFPIWCKLENSTEVIWSSGTRAVKVFVAGLHQRSGRCAVRAAGLRAKTVECRKLSRARKFEESAVSVGSLKICDSIEISVSGLDQPVGFYPVFAATQEAKGVDRRELTAWREFENRAAPIRIAVTGNAAILRYSVEVPIGRLNETHRGGAIAAVWLRAKVVKCGELARGSQLK